MQIVDVAMTKLETTCRMPREELLGLLNTMTPVERQRVTAEFGVPQPPPDLVITFKQQPARLSPTRMFVIGASFAVSFGLGLIVSLL